MVLPDQKKPNVVSIDTAFCLCLRFYSNGGGTGAELQIQRCYLFWRAIYDIIFSNQNFPTLLTLMIFLLNQN